MYKQMIFLSYFTMWSATAFAGAQAETMTILEAETKFTEHLSLEEELNFFWIPGNKMILISSFGPTLEISEDWSFVPTTGFVINWHQSSKTVPHTRLVNRINLLHERISIILDTDFIFIDRALDYFALYEIKWNTRYISIGTHLEQFDYEYTIGPDVSWKMDDIFAQTLEFHYNPENNDTAVRLISEIAL